MGLGEERFVVEWVGGVLEQRREDECSGLMGGPPVALVSIVRHFEEGEVAVIFQKLARKVGFFVEDRLIVTRVLE